MKSPNKQKPGTLGGGVGPGRAETTNLESQYSPSALHFRLPWLRIVCRSLAIKAQPCDLSRSLAVSALVAEIREALR